MKGCVVFQLWPKSLQHHIITALKESDRTGGVNDGDIQDTGKCPAAMWLCAHYNFPPERIGIQMQLRLSSGAPQDPLEQKWCEKSTSSCVTLASVSPKAEEREGIYKIFTSVQYVAIISIWQCNLSNFCNSHNISVYKVRIGGEDDDDEWIKVKVIFLMQRQNAVNLVQTQATVQLSVQWFSIHWGHQSYSLSNCLILYSKDRRGLSPELAFPAHVAAWVCWQILRLCAPVSERNARCS